MAEPRGHVAGSHNEHNVVFYGLSTCIWCRRTREFLEDQGVTFDFHYVDLLEGAARDEAIAEVRRWNPAVSFPTIVVNGETSVVGFRPEELQRVLGL